MHLRIAAVVTSLLVSLTAVAQPSSCLSFTRSSRASDGPEPYAAAGGDFNGDGRSDLVVSYGVGRGFTVFLGSPTGALTKAGTYVPSATAPVSAVHAADLDGDGRLDLVASAGPNLHLFSGNGDGSFAAGPVDPVAKEVSDLEVADVTGDGIADIIASLTYGPLTLLRGLGGGTFAPAASLGPTQLTSITTGDYDGDGLLDIAAVGFGTTVTLLFSRGNGSFESPVGYGINGSPSLGPAAIVTTDYNHDGHADLLIATISAGAVKMRNLGNLAFVPDGQLAPSTPGYAIALADFDGDGRNDVIVSAFNGFDILLANGDGTYAAPSFTRTVPAGAIGSPAGPFVAGDFRGLGTMDVALGNRTHVLNAPQTIELYLNGCVMAGVPALNVLGALLALASLAVSGWWMTRR